MRLGGPAFALALVVLLASGAAAERVPIPGTRVRMEVPAGFSVSHEFPGIGHDEDLTSILVTELAFPIEIARPTLSREALAERGVRLHDAVPVEVSGRRALLVHASQRARGISFRKWMLLLGDGSGSVLVTATTPRELEATHQVALVEALRSVVWTPTGPDPSSVILPFEVDAPAPLRIVTTATNAVVFANPDHDPGPDGVAPLVSVGESLAQVEIDDLPAFARQRLLETPTVDEIEVEREAPRLLAGMPGHEIHARARDTQSEREVRIIQLLALGESRYYLIQTIAQPDDAASFERAYDAVANSFRLR
jgi:hypothetical protein